MAPDDLRILDDDEPLRRLAPRSAFKSDLRTVTRGAFKANNVLEHEISVQVSRLLASPLQALEHHPTFGLGVLRVGDVRSLGLEVRLDPLPGDPAHALIVGEMTLVLADQLVQLLSIIKYPE